MAAAGEPGLGARGKNRSLRGRGNNSGIAVLTDESVCPTLVRHGLHFCGAGAFACQPFFSRLLTRAAGAVLVDTTVISVNLPGTSEPLSPVLEQLAIIEMDGAWGISQRRGSRHRHRRRGPGGENAGVGLGSGAWIGPGRVCGLAL